MGSVCGSILQLRTEMGGGEGSMSLTSAWEELGTGVWDSTTLLICFFFIHSHFSKIKY